MLRQYEEKDLEPLERFKIISIKIKYTYHLNKTNNDLIFKKDLFQYDYYYTYKI